MESAQAINTQTAADPKPFAESIAYLLRESFEGTPDGLPNVYLDRGVGFFGTLQNVSADAASSEFYGTTIAAQTEHAKFYLDRLAEFMSGRSEKVNWEDSWLIETVSEAEWDALRESVKKAYENTLRCLASIEEWNERNLGMAVGMVAHTAYHLGAIRQIAKITE